MLSDQARLDLFKRKWGARYLPLVQARLHANKVDAKYHDRFTQDVFDGLVDGVEFGDLESDLQITSRLEDLVDALAPEPTSRRVRSSETEVVEEPDNGGAELDDDSAFRLVMRRIQSGNLEHYKAIRALKLAGFGHDEIIELLKGKYQVSAMTVSRAVKDLPESVRSCRDQKKGRWGSAVILGLVGGDTARKYWRHFSTCPRCQDRAMAAWNMGLSAGVAGTGVAAASAAGAATATAIWIMAKVLLVAAFVLAPAAMSLRSCEEEGQAGKSASSTPKPLHSGDNPRGVDSHAASSPAGNFDSGDHPTILEQLKHDADVVAAALARKENVALVFEDPELATIYFTTDDAVVPCIKSKFPKPFATSSLVKPYSYDSSIGNESLCGYLMRARELVLVTTARQRPDGLQIGPIYSFDGNRRSLNLAALVPLSALKSSADPTSWRSFRSEHPDSDLDLVPDFVEEWLTTDPHNSDSDGDGLEDAEELGAVHSNPAMTDTDGDGKDDAAELRNGQSPLVSELFLSSGDEECPGFVAVYALTDSTNETFALSTSRATEVKRGGKSIELRAGSQPLFYAASRSGTVDDLALVESIWTPYGVDLTGLGVLLKDAHTAIGFIAVPLQVHDQDPLNESYGGPNFRKPKVVNTSQGVLYPLFVFLPTDKPEAKKQPWAQLVTSFDDYYRVLATPWRSTTVVGFAWSTCPKPASVK